MNKYFTNNGIRESDTFFNESVINKIKSHWQSFVADIEDYPDQFAGRGIVICSGGLKYFTCSWVLISMLRAQGCSLPIEVWYSGNELSTQMIDDLTNLGVDCKNLQDFYGNAKGFIVKPLAILNSKFEEVLFLDADNLTVRDPSFLFDDENYKISHCIFWPDYWRTSRNNQIWKILGINFMDVPEQESGQILINKRHCWKELNLCLYFNALGKTYYKFLYGDKDTFRFAWLALNSTYYMIEQAPSVCGYLSTNSDFYGMTIVQHDPVDEILFMHRNLLKWDITVQDEYCWQVLKKFKIEAEVKEYNLYLGNNRHWCIDIIGDTIAENFKDSFPKLEIACMDVLKSLRLSKLYKEVIGDKYISNNR